MKVDNPLSGEDHEEPTGASHPSPEALTARVRDLIRGLHARSGAQKLRKIAEDSAGDGRHPISAGTVGTLVGHAEWKSFPSTDSVERLLVGLNASKDDTKEILAAFGAAKKARLRAQIAEENTQPSVPAEGISGEDRHHELVPQRILKPPRRQRVPYAVVIAGVVALVVVVALIAFIRGEQSERIPPPERHELRLDVKASPPQVSWIIAAKADSKAPADFAVECKNALNHRASCLGASEAIFTILPNRADRVAIVQVQQNPTSSTAVCVNATGYSTDYLVVSPGDFYCIKANGWIAAIVVEQLPEGRFTAESSITVTLGMTSWRSN